MELFLCSVVLTLLIIPSMYERVPICLPTKCGNRKRSMHKCPVQMCVYEGKPYNVCAHLAHRHPELFPSITAAFAIHKCQVCRYKGRKNNLQVHMKTAHPELSKLQLFELDMIRVTGIIWLPHWVCKKRETLFVNEHLTFAPCPQTEQDGWE